jgi:hypothetical protein
MMYKENYQRIRRAAIRTVGVIFATSFAGGFSLHAQVDTNKLEQENQELRKRVGALEDLMKKEGIQPSASATAAPVSAMSAMTISGYVSASYFYDLANSKDNAPTGYLWNTRLNSFDLNEVKLTLASPPVDKDKWDAAYRVSLLYGQDAAFLNSGNGITGFNSLREAYVDLNVPIGTGLDLKAGELISLLNYESGDGGAANDNFSQGYQWWYTGNGPAAGVQAGYDFNDWIGIKLRLQNGLFTGPVDTGSKTFVGGLYIKPDKKTSLTFLGFAGRQNLAIPTTWYDDGVEFIGTRKLTDKDNLSFATELDYWKYSINGNFPNPGPAGKHSDFWSVGGWLTGDLMPKTAWALRADFLDDPTGFATLYQSPNPAGGATGFPGRIATGGHGQELMSVTLTLNWKPAANLKIQPEVRWDHSTVSTALNGKSDQVIVGMGASYMF